MRRTILGVAAAHCAVLALASRPSAGEPRELRGVWIAAADEEVFRSRESLAEALEFLARHHVNAVFPDVWYRGVTLHPSDLLERTLGVRQDPRYAGRDPLAELLVEAHRRGIEVIPWFEYGFAAAHAERPTNVLEQHPGWAARDARGEVVRKNGFAWMNAFDPEVQAFVAGLVLEVARGYDVDGVQGDDRLPALPATGGYDEFTARLWRQQKRLAPPAADDARWIDWRAGLLTDFLARLARDVRASGDGVLVSASPSPWRWGLDEYLQDSRTWVERGLVDLFHPQCYRRDFESYARLADEQRALLPAQSRAVYAPGILIESGSWRIAPLELVRMVEHGRERGYGGEVLFHYAGLRADGGRLARALLDGPYADRARVPHRSQVWRPAASEFEPRAGMNARSASYALNVRTTAWYGVHVEFPAGAALPPSIDCRGPREFEPEARIEPRSGLVRVGRVRLAARSAAELAIEAPADWTGALTLGKAVLILDRRRSPGALVRD
jgi:uncharacterized lipoprotein YddW (UPF0748 family)